ncbi:hypothetical protein ACJMK2_037925 [Sinanodonta woodiana]|uniref:Acid sphingomyelinase-like phosphodiesterase n=1 Tax=Sinanodonta woodiana TaxID=1069815 RepID=A0ABD3WLY9_SINWO
MFRKLVLLLFTVELLGRTDCAEGSFWHITDLHLDFTYWNEQLSCHGINISSPGKFGNYWCDSSYELVHESIRQLANIKSDVDFVLWTGDSVPHISNLNLSTKINLNLVSNITNALRETFRNAPVYPTFGNHDYYSDSQFPPNGNDMYNLTLMLWQTWINDSMQEDNFRKGGYYTVKIAPGIRLVALNTNLYYTRDLLTAHLQDPSDQLAWLDNVLAQATAQREKIIIAGHVPPGFTTPTNRMWMYPQYNLQLNLIVKKYASIIVAMHFGHEHHDNFRLYYADHGHPLVALFIAPSITPWRSIVPASTEPAHNPGARLVKYDRKSGSHLDVLQYYVDLPQANRDNILTWRLGYSATVDYKIPDVTPASLDKLIQRMAPLESEEFKRYVIWYNTNATTNFPCDQFCHKSVICGMKNVDEISFKNCIQNP